MVIMVTEQLHSAESEANFYTYLIPTYSVQIVCIGEYTCNIPG